jgi:hypothetical protein
MMPAVVCHRRSAAAQREKSALMNQLRNKAVEQTTLSSPLRMMGRRQTH